VDIATLDSGRRDLVSKVRDGEAAMKVSFLMTALLAAVLPAPAFANSRIKIDTIPSEYAPLNSPTNREPVSLSSFHFEVDQETGRARVIAEYTYPDQTTYGPDDDAGGPRPTIVQLPGLTYDAAAHAVVYDSNGNQTVCATVGGQAGLFGRRLKVKNTGACTVTTVAADHAEDTGWDIRRFRAIDAYFEVH
jgi:hypothetical protein